MKASAIKNGCSAILSTLAAIVALFLSVSPPASAEGICLGAVPVNIVTSCAELSAEGRADAEWTAYLTDYTARRNLECRLSGLSGDAWMTENSELCQIYGCADAESREKLLSIAGKYGLSLLNTRESTELCDLPLPKVENANWKNAQYLCSDGAFAASGTVSFEGWVCEFTYSECPTGVLGTWSLDGKIFNQYSRWNHTLPCGTELRIDMAPYNSGEQSGFRQIFLYYRAADRIISVCANVPNGRTGAEQFADHFWIE